VIYTGYEDVERVKVPDYGRLRRKASPSGLPKEIAPFTGRGVYDEEHHRKVSCGEHTSFIQGSGHGGSHPHLTHEFIRAIVENRESAVDARTAANWTMTGICAHESAMNRVRNPEDKVSNGVNDGKRIQIPRTD